MPENHVMKNTKRSRKVMDTLKQALLDWEKLINSIYPLFKVTVENKVDTEGNFILGILIYDMWNYTRIIDLLVFYTR